MALHGKEVAFKRFGIYFDADRTFTLVIPYNRAIQFPNSFGLCNLLIGNISVLNSLLP